jgi:hypothetical protein
MWVFHQSTGSLEHNGKVVAGGYSGARSLAINLFEAARFYGPIPRGSYRLGWSFSKKSHGYVLSLTPMGHNAQGREAFLIHGDYIDARKKGTASEGCIIMPLDVRKAIWESSDRILSVQL